MQTSQETAHKPGAPTSSVNAAFYYAPEGFDTSSSKLMGRHAAGEGFMNAFVRYAKVPAYYCFSKQKSDAVHFFDHFGKAGPEGTKTIWIPAGETAQLKTPGCLFLPGPDLSEFAWQRRHDDQRAYSLCGITHTTSSDRIMDCLGNFLIAPVQPWDAVICTTNSTRRMVENIVTSHHAYLCRRLGTDVAMTMPRLPVIPLGVECDHFVASSASRKFRADYRTKEGIGEDDIAVLYMGRLSYHAKAHPYPMYAALEAAAQKTGKRVHLLMVGWFANQALEDQFRQAARIACPSVNVIFVDGRTPEIRKNIWFAADIFSSLSDNIQETFGLTPIEAMAAGLPGLVSDWDGYKETVRDGLDGFRVPTCMPEPGAGVDLALRYAISEDNYDRYIGQVSMATAVDIPACTEAFVQLIENPVLRRKMGLSAQIHARDTYDWRVVISAYQTLWAELAELREQSPERAPRQDDPPNPLRNDPYAVFAHYPSSLLTGQSRLAVIPSMDILRQWQQVRSIEMNTYCDSILAEPDTQQAILRQLSEGERLVDDLLNQFKATSPAVLMRTFGWFLKTGLLQVVETQ